jgi:hypothetical protein
VIDQQSSAPGNTNAGFVICSRRFSSALPISIRQPRSFAARRMFPPFADGEGELRVVTTTSMCFTESMMVRGDFRGLSAWVANTTNIVN